eukprot:SAG31_NODE_11824_length_995_cov_0.931920_1_plen_162_part_10
MRVLELPLVLALLPLVARAEAMPRRNGGEEAPPSRHHHGHTNLRAADVARAAAATCGELPTEQALRAVKMPVAAAHRAGEVLTELGFDTALDLEILGGGDAAAEVLTELKASGLGPADRAKVRLLVGDRRHLEALAQGAARATASCSGFDEEDLSLGDRLAD